MFESSLAFLYQTVLSVSVQKHKKISLGSETFPTFSRVSPVDTEITPDLLFTLLVACLFVQRFPRVSVLRCSGSLKDVYFYQLNMLVAHN